MFLLVMSLSLLSSIEWAKASDSDIEEYRQGTYRKLSHIVVPAAIYCKDALCKDCEHRHQIEEYYDNMCNALSSRGKLTIPTCRFRCSQEFIVPGFNEHLKELHGKARECYLVWKYIDRPRTGDVHDDMRVSRLRFKYVLRQCRANEEMMRADALAHSLSSRDSTSFWKDVGKMANSKVPLASKVENAVGNHEITDMWKI